MSALLSTLAIEWAGQVLAYADPSRFPWESLELASIRVFLGSAELQGWEQGIFKKDLTACYSQVAGLH